MYYADPSDDEVPLPVSDRPIEAIGGVLALAWLCSGPGQLGAQKDRPKFMTQISNIKAIERRIFGLEKVEK